METTKDKLEIAREPRISINKLADYLQTSSVTKRRKILYDQKFPQKSEFKTLWYDQAKRPIKKSLLNSDLKLNAISQVIDKLQKEIIELKMKYPEVASDILKHKNKIQKKESCLEALTNFSENIMLFDKYKTHNFSTDNASGFIEIGGVRVSVEPDVIITGAVRGKEFLGGLKLYFSKVTKLDKEMGKTISSVIYHYLNDFSDKASSQYCFVLDVMNSTTFTASSSYSRKIREIEIACDEIRIIWPSLEVKA